MSKYQIGIPPCLQTQINSSIEPPVVTKLQELPFDKLAWEDFEKLCLRLVQSEADIEGYCQLYGEKGDGQAGIDLYARKHLEEKYTIYQCKRVKDFGAAKIVSAVNKFLEGDWVDKTKTFVLCTSESLVLKKRADAVVQQRERLLQKQIELIIWDRPQLSSKLKELPELVSDFFGDAWTEAFCGQSIQTSSNTQVITEKYLNWLTDITASFLVPGLGKKLSIETAWIPLKVKTLKSESQPSTQTVKEQLAKYHQDSNQSDDQELIIDIDNVDKLSGRVVFIGRSGMGKSTTLKRLAHFLAKNNKKVVLIRLSKVAKYFASGVSFEDALVMEAADSSGIDSESLKTILSHPDYLLADGLDECASQQALIAQKLVEWSTGHPQTKIILTSRPFGFDHAYFPEWQCLDILSLKSTEVKKNVELLLKALFDNEVKVYEELNRFVEKIEVNKTASVAAQNPLLLGFLLQLSINGIELLQSRSDLYQSIIGLAYQQSLPDREFKIELDEPIARRVLEIIGWHLQQNSDITKQDLVKNIGKEIKEELDIKYLAGQQKAQQGIDFWEERRIIEIFKIGNKEFVTFAHLSLREYLAGSYAATLNNEWLQKVRRQPKYRETILFAASSGVVKEICECLLELDDYQDPTSIEALLAAEALIETKQKFSDIADKIIEFLKSRLESEIPYLAFEAAEKLLDLVPQAKDTIGSLALSLLDNRKFWVRLSGIRLGLECGADYVDLEILTDFLNKFAIQPLERDFSYSQIPFSTYPKINRARYYGRIGWEFQNQILPLGVKLLLKRKPDSATDKCIENLKQQDHFSAGTCQAIDKALMDYDIECLKNRQPHKAITQIQKLFAEKLDIKKLSSDKLLSTWKKSKKKAEIAFLESILRIEKSDSIALPTSSKSPQSTLAKLFAGMKWWNQTTTAWDVLGNQDDIDVIDTVIVGAIVAMQINLQQLAEEALQALEKIKESDNTEIDNSKTSEEIKNIFGSPSTQPSFSPSWELAKEINLCPENLVLALKHPSDGIRYNAILLLDHGAGGSEAPKLIEKMLKEENDENILWAISNLAPNIFGEQTLKMFLDKLDQPLTKGSRYLLKCLPQICKYYNIQDKSRVFSNLLTALNTENPRVAASAGEALSEFEISQIADLGSQIKEAFDWWIERGTWCDKHQITTHERSCPKCRTVLDRPQSKLVRILTRLELRLELIDNDELIDLCTDSKSGVQDEAVDSLVQKAANNKTLLISLLEKIYLDESLAKVLIKLLTLSPPILTTVETELMKLYNSDSVIVREIIVKYLQNSECLDKQEAISLLENALIDEDIPIRNQAVVSLRSIKNINL